MWVLVPLHPPSGATWGGVLRRGEFLLCLSALRTAFRMHTAVLSSTSKLLNMLSRHATMGLLLLRATASLAWTPAAVRLNRSVAARSGGHGCRRCPAAPSSSSRSSSSRGGARALATATSTPAGATIDGEDGEKGGPGRPGSEVIGGQDAGASPQVYGGVEIQPLLRPHMEILGSAGRRK